MSNNNSFVYHFQMFVRNCDVQDISYGAITHMRMHVKQINTFTNTMFLNKLALELTLGWMGKQHHSMKAINATKVPTSRI